MEDELFKSLATSRKKNRNIAKIKGFFQLINLLLKQIPAIKIALIGAILLYFFIKFFCN